MRPTRAPARAPMRLAASYDAAILATTGLQFYWKLNDGATPYAEAGGSGNALALYGSLGSPGGSGQPCFGDASAQFNGSGHLALSTPVTSDPDPLTVECWFRTLASGMLTELGNDPSGPGGYDHVLYVGGDGKLHWYIFNVSILDDPNFVMDGQWHYVAATYNGATNTMSITVDGNAASTETGVTQSVFSSNYWWLFGGGTNFGAGPLNGNMSRIAVYSTLLSSSQMLAHFHAGGGR